MPFGTPFHSRTAALCVSQNWRTWSGYFVASSYEVVHDYEYHAIRNSAGLIDVSPLYKYDVRGKDAAALVDRVITRNAAKCAVGQALYACLCEGDGAVLQDGTVFRIAENYFRFHLAEPALRWLKLNALALDVSIEEVSEKIAALALQGPNAASILASLVDFDLGHLKFFRFASGKIYDVAVIVSRTGYTGDLGYEIWHGAEHAERVWDAFMEHGADFGIKPAGLLALDVARVEAGLLLIDVDFQSGRKALVEEQRYSPFELGLDRLVRLDKGAFVGRDALVEAARRGPARRIVGVEIDWPSVEALYGALGMAPQIAAATSRAAVPVYRGGRQVGRATSTTWSPVLKKLIALATIDRPHFAPGTPLEFEITVEAVRHRVPAQVVSTPFFNPPRKTAVPLPLIASPS